MSSHPSISEFDTSFLVDFTDHISQDSAIHINGNPFVDVYKCIWNDSGQSRTVAVRATRYFEAEDPKENKRKLSELNSVLRRELASWDKLDHPNVLPLLGSTYSFGPTIAAVSPWISLGTLQSFLKKEGQTITSVEQLEMVYGIVSGIAYLHSVSVYHGDLNSTNVLIDEAHKPRISDFGFASVLERLQHLQWLSNTNQPVVARWAAPERLAGCKPHPSMDVYSFGCLMLEVLSRGDIPWKEKTDYEVIAMKLSGHKPPTRSLYVVPDDEHWALMSRCWSSPPQRRPAARQVVALIEGFLQPDNFIGFLPPWLHPYYDYIPHYTRKTMFGLRSMFE